MSWKGLWRSGHRAHQTTRLIVLPFRRHHPTYILPQAGALALASLGVQETPTIAIVFFSTFQALESGLIQEVKRQVSSLLSLPWPANSQRGQCGGHHTLISRHLGLDTQLPLIHRAKVHTTKPQSTFCWPWLREQAMGGIRNPPLRSSP